MKINTHSALYGTLVLTLSNILLQILGFVYRVFIARLIGAEGMGLFSLVMPAYSVIMSLAASGLTVAVSHLTAGYQALGHTRAAAQLVRRALGVFLVLFFAVTAIVAPLSDGISVWLLGDARTRAGLLFLLPCILFTGLENIHKSHFYGLKKIHQPAASELIEMTVRTGAVILLLTMLKPAHEEPAVALIILGMVICEITSASLLRVMYRHEQAHVLPSGPTLPLRPMLREISRIAVPIAMANLLANLIGAANSVMIPSRLVTSGMTPAAALSAYGVVTGMSMPLLSLPYAFIAALTLVMIPRLSEDLTLGRTTALRRRTTRTLTATTLAIIPSMALLVIFGPRLALLLFKHEAAGAHFPLLALGALMSCYQGIMGSLLSGLGKQGKTAANMTAAGLLQLALTWFLTAQPLLRLRGFIFAFVISSFAGAVLCALDLYRFFGIAMRKNQPHSTRTTRQNKVTS